MTADPITDYPIQLATYLKSNAPSWMVPRFEGPNETWNFDYPVATYFSNKAQVYWSAFDRINMYGKVVSVLGQAISTVYSADRTKYQVLCGVQTGNGSFTGGTSQSRCTT